MKSIFNIICAGALLGAFWQNASAAEYELANFMETTDGLNIPMVYVDHTTFQMGATPEQENPEDDELVHTVTISPFYIGATEITQAQWEKVMGTSLEDMYNKYKPALEYGKHGVGPDRPMYYVSWNDATDFCRKLSALTGLIYRLPTEAEWELAARGGCTGNTNFAGSNNLDSVAWYVDNADMDRFNRGNPESHPVTTLSPNAIGIFDMSGNVCEWCYDYYAPYPTVETTDPVGVHQPSLDDRVYRGGSFRSNKGYCRVAFRNSNSADYASEFLGFRVVCEP
ncbi:MAG: formylglycine-generating enzyme family protein [Firmicutes bacterium]|nr:formylglycine-generating enzyme family protein [Bacillota bacterium]MCM1401299.1 formylglycine-generating enzyme family protein [Bacteroides sp.]MCM1476746.1 formylglycine-generating enzyme family protein [Bacteroides sp.]